MSKLLGSTSLSTIADDDDSWGKWGKANTRRGRNYDDIAKATIAKFPIGHHFSNDEFDAWLQECEMLVIPPEDAAKNSDAWLAHLQRRHQCRARINKAATHPRMTDDGSMPFILTAIRNGVEVQSPQVAAASAGLPNKISSLVNTKRKQLSYLMQSADWAVLPPHEQAIAEAIYDDIDMFSTNTQTTADHIGRKLGKLQHRIKQLIEAGTVVSNNGGLRQLLSAPAEEDDDASGA